MRLSQLSEKKKTQKKVCLSIKSIDAADIVSHL